jgi:hypothetical protein
VPSEFPTPAQPCACHHDPHQPPAAAPVVQPQPPAAPVYYHPTAHLPVPARQGQVGTWVGIGLGAGALLLTASLAAMALAVSAVSVAVCALVIRWIIRDIRKG